MSQNPSTLNALYMAGEVYTSPLATTITRHTKALCDLLSNANYISIDGTRPWLLADWRTNFNISLLPVNGVRLSEGIYREGMAVHDWMERLHFLPSDAIVFCGHSQGGAVAKFLFWHRLHHQPHSPTGLITFGATRTGDRHFNQECQNYSRTAACITYTQYAHPADPVPELPPSYPAYHATYTVDQRWYYPLLRKLPLVHLFYHSLGRYRRDLGEETEQTS